MNKIERIIYDMVKSKPGLKRAFRNIYQSLFDLMPAKRINSEYKIKILENKFFGFHDHSPFSVDERFVLSCVSPSLLSMPQLGQKISLCLDYVESSKDSIILGKTPAWNWHMGSKLQWFGEENIFFNDLENGSPLGRFVGVSGDRKFELNAHFSSLNFKEAIGVGYSFSRVEQGMPGYGYLNQKKSSSDDVLIPKDCGLYAWDLNAQKETFFISIEEIASSCNPITTKDCFHFVTHALLNKTASKIAFIHRWVESSNIDIRRSRLMLLDVESQSLLQLSFGNMISHFHWLTENSIIAYCNVPGLGDRYCIIDTTSLEVNPLSNSALTSDGHPHPNIDGKMFVSDTYPNRRRMQELFLFNIENSEKTSLGSFYHPKEFQSPDIYTHWCVDLHPRWSLSGRYISFDSCNSGIRSHCILDLESG
jgi:hypothetical protein